MDSTGKIIRRSIHTLLRDFHYFTTIPVILMLPFSASILLSQFVYQYFSQANSFLDSAGISFLGPTLSQMIFGYVFSLPFALSFLGLAKASVIHSLNYQRPTFSLTCSSFTSLYKPFVLTFICSTVLIITINTAAFFSLSAISNLFAAQNNFVFILAQRIVFCLLFTNIMVIHNLALAVAGIDCCAGYYAIHKACLLRKVTNSQALLLALPINFGLAAIEALFRYRIIRAFHVFRWLSSSMVFEGLLIAYLFSLLEVLETIACCLFIKSCDTDLGREQAETCYIHVVVVKEESRISC